MSDANGFTIEWQRAGRNGLATITVRLGGDVAALETFNLGKPKERTKFAKGLAGKFPALDAAGIASTRSGLVVREAGRRRREPLWPFSQVLHATVAVAPYDADARERLTGLWTALEAYRRGDGYAERPRLRTRYYDDDAWIALAALADGSPASAARAIQASSS